MNPATRTLATLAALVASVSLAAAPIQIDDSQVDYSNSDLETAYLTLSESSGKLTVSLSDAATGAHALPVDMTDVPIVKGTDFFGDTKYYGVLTDSGSPVTLTLVGNVPYGIGVTHWDVSLDEAVDAYVAGLAAAGDPTTVELDGTYAVVTSGSGVRIVLQDVFNGVKAYIAG